MNVYLASPGNQLQAAACLDMNVLISYVCSSKWLRDYEKSFNKILIDSGAYSELNSGKKVDILAYRDWSARFIGTAEAIAGLDDIRGDWKRSLKNYETISWSFPTWHDTDPLELLDDLVAISLERKTWLGIGLLPPRERKERVIREALERIPESIHVHGWALRGYTHIRRLASVDSTNWYLDAMKILTLPYTKHLTYAEALDIVIKRYKRETRVISDIKQAGLFV